MSLPQDCLVGKVPFLARFNDWASDCTIVTLDFPVLAKKRTHAWEPIPPGGRRMRLSANAPSCGQLDVARNIGS